MYSSISSISIKSSNEMCSLFFFVAFILLPIFSIQSPSKHSVDFHIGVILDLNSTDSAVGRIGMRCLSIAHSDFYSFHRDYRTRLVLHPLDSNGSVVDAAAAALHLLRDVKVDAIIGPQKSTQVSFVMDLGEKAHVPIISFSATSPSLVHRAPYFVQTAQSDANQVQAITSIIKAFQWTQVVIIFEDSEFGNGIMPYLSNALQDVNARVPHRSSLPRSATDESIKNALYKMMTMQTRVFIVHTSQFLGTRLFLNARELGMMSEGYAWIVTSGMTDQFPSISSHVADAMQGVIGVRPLIPNSQELNSFASRLRKSFLDDHDVELDGTSIFGLWAYDTLWALAMAAESVGISRSSANENEESVDFTSTFASGVSNTGPNLLKAVLDTRFRGIAGEFNLVYGQLEQTSYEIVYVVESIQRHVGTWNPVSNSASKDKFQSIIWPGDSTRPPKGWEDPINGKKLRIAVPEKPGFNDFLKVETDPQTNTTNVTGYYKEVFDAVMKALPYSLPYEFVPYSFIKGDGSRGGTYDDLVYQVSLQKDFDGALGDITITANRSDYADFTMPYAEGGIACIVPVKYEDVNDVFTFLQPLTKEMWLTTVVLYISTAVVTWILAKKVERSSRDSIGQHLGMNSSLLPFLPGESIEVILICVIIVTWAFVANLLNSTYTASLSSRLTIATLRASVTHVKQLIANRDYVGYQDGSFLQTYLVNRGFDESRLKNYTSVDACKEALSLGSKRDGVSAYCDVLPHIKRILSESCGKYMIIDPIYRTDGFAFAFPKYFPAVSDISRAIVRLLETGTFLEIEQRHLPTPDCAGAEGSSSLARVSLRSFSVLFAITGFVTIVCYLVSLLFHLHKKRPLRQRMTDFETRACSRIRDYFRRDERSSRPMSTDSRDDTPTIQEGNSSNDHIIEVVEIVPHHHRFEVV